MQQLTQQVILEISYRQSPALVPNHDNQEPRCYSNRRGRMPLLHATHCIQRAQRLDASIIPVGGMSHKVPLQTGRHGPHVTRSLPTLVCPLQTASASFQSLWQGWWSSTDRQTNRPHYDVCRNIPHPALHLVMSAKKYTKSSPNRNKIA